MKKAQLAVIMTCFNRRSTTVSCLRALHQQKNSVEFDVYLTDDGSSDGTADAVKKEFPAVNILQGNGNLYWVGGMRLAFASSIKKDYDYYLWLNDDTILEADAIERLFLANQKISEQTDKDLIVVGTTKDIFTGIASYGGSIKSQKWYSNKFDFLGCTQYLEECDTFFGNCVLISRNVVQKVGNIDPAFIHSMGDTDYGLRAKKKNCSIWVAPGYVGTCSKNSVSNSWVDTKLSVLERLKKAIHIKAFPLKSWTVFCRRHSGLFWFIYWILPYLRAVIGYRNLAASPTFVEEVEKQRTTITD